MPPSIFMRILPSSDFAFCLLFVAVAIGFGGARSGEAETLVERLTRVAPSDLAEQAMRSGDAKRGALLFYQQHLTCTQCHGEEAGDANLGPRLSTIGEDTEDAYLVESILHPSRAIKKGYETVVLTIDSGQTISGLVTSEDDDSIEIKELTNLSQTRTIAKDAIDDRTVSSLSSMPAGLINLAMTILPGK